MPNLIQKLFKLTASRLNIRTAFRRAGISFLNRSPVSISDNLESYVREGFEGNDDLYAVIKTVVDACLSLNYKIVKKTADGKEEPVADHPFLEVMQTPNRTQTWKDYAALEITMKLVLGNSYTVFGKPMNGQNAGQVKQMFVMPSQYMRIDTTDEFANPISGYSLDLLADVSFLPENVMHRKDVNMNYDGTGSYLYGMSRLKPARSTLRTSNDSKLAAMKLLQNTGAYGILTGDANGQYSEEQMKSIKDKYRDMHQGADKYGDIIISSQPFKWIQMGLNAVDMQLVELQDSSLRRLCNLYHVNPILLMADAKYDNIKQVKASLYQDAAIPEMQQLLDHLTRSALWSYGDTSLRLKVDYSGIDALKPDLERISNAVSKVKGSFTHNEIREMMGRPRLELPDMDTPIFVLENETFLLESERQANSFDA